MAEVSVKLVNAEEGKRYVQKFIVEQPFSVSKDDPILEGLVNETIKQFHAPFEECEVKIVVIC